METPRKQKVSALIINLKGELLVVRKKGETIWISPGGKLNLDPETKQPTETYEECLARELEEELGLTRIQSVRYMSDPVIEVAATNDPNQQLEMEFHFYRITEYEGDPLLNPDDNVEEFKWISIADFERSQSNESTMEIASGLSKHAIAQLIADGLMK